MNKYVFMTDEGYTYQPNSTSTEPDCENSQVLGIFEGNNEEEAYQNLLDKNNYLLRSNFKRIYCYKLASDSKRKDFFI